MHCSKARSAAEVRASRDDCRLEVAGGSFLTPAAVQSLPWCARGRLQLPPPALLQPYPAAAAAALQARTSRRELKAFYPAGGKGKQHRPGRAVFRVHVRPLDSRGCQRRHSPDPSGSPPPACSRPAGSWSSGHPTPFVAIHATVMKNGELVIWTVSSAAAATPVHAEQMPPRCRPLPHRGSQIPPPPPLCMHPGLASSTPLSAPPPAPVHPLQPWNNKYSSAVYFPGSKSYNKLLGGPGIHGEHKVHCCGKH